MILERIQDAWRANNVLLGRDQDHSLPFKHLKGWKRVDPTIDTNERFGYSRASIRQDELRRLVETTVQERSLRNLDDQDTDLGNSNDTSVPWSGTNSRGLLESDEEARIEAVRKARIRRAMRETRRPDGSSSGLNKHPPPPQKFIMRCKEELLRLGLELFTGRHGQSESNMDDPVSHGSDSLFRILTSFKTGGRCEASRDTRREVVSHMETCLRCQALVVQDEADIYGTLRPNNDSERQQLIDKHFKYCPCLFLFCG